MEEKRSINIFFRYMGLVAFFSAINTDLSKLPMFDIVKNVTMTFMYNFIVGIPGGLAWMFGTDLYLYLKKNT